MDLSNLTVFSAVTRRMSWLAKRQEVLSQNVANADTPGYIPSDLKAQSFAGYLPGPIARAELRKTQPDHLDPQDLSRAAEPQKTRNYYEIMPSGNAVVLEEQLMNINQVQGDYRLATNLYSKHIAMLRAALGRPNG